MTRTIAPRASATRYWHGVLAACGALGLAGCAPDDVSVAPVARQEQAAGHETLESLQRCSDSDVLPETLLQGLSLQLVEDVLCAAPDALVFYEPCQEAGCLWPRRGHVPVGQPALVAALHDVAHARNDYISVRALYLDLGSHTLLRWKKEQCDGTLVAPRLVDSPLLGGLAAEVPFYSTWRVSLLAAHFVHNAERSPSLFEWRGGADAAAAHRALHTQSIEAFQRLWNLNHPDDLLTVDGVYGDATASRVLRAPVAGFARSYCSTLPTEPPDEGADPETPPDDGDPGELPPDGPPSSGHPPPLEPPAELGDDTPVYVPPRADLDLGAGVDADPVWELGEGRRGCAQGASHRDSPRGLGLWILALGAAVRGRRKRAETPAISPEMN